MDGVGTGLLMSVPMLAWRVGAGEQRVRRVSTVSAFWPCRAAAAAGLVLLLVGVGLLVSFMKKQSCLCTVRPVCRAECRRRECQETDFESLRCCCQLNGDAHEDQD